MKYIYIIKPREKSNEDKDLIFFLLFINNVCHASKVRTVPFTNCRHIGHFRMARAQSVQQQRCPSLYRSYTSLGPLVVYSPRSIIECL